MLTASRCSFSLLYFEMSIAVCFSQELCDPWMRADITNFTIFANRSAWDINNRILYPQDTYWIDKDKQILHACPCMLDKPCMRKCCQKHEAMDNETLQCIPHDSPWPWFRPNVPIDEDGNIRTENSNYFGLTFGNFCFGYLLEPDAYPEEDKFYINITDGTLTIPLVNKTSYKGMGPANYCLEYVPSFDSYLPYVCFEKDPQTEIGKCHKARYVFYPMGMLISIISLLISLTVYILIPDLRNFHGKCLISHMISLLFGFIFLGTVQAFGESLSDNVCVNFGIVIYFFLLAAFFWLNIVCIDICIAFSNLQPLSGSPTNREVKKFLLYMSYAWGIPTVMTTIVAIMELHPDIPERFYRPEFKKTCWFKSFNSRIAYFVAPVGIIVLCNIILFLITAINIYKIKKETKMLMAANSKKHNKTEDKTRFKLYIKLSIVMGVSWVMEIISGLVGGSPCLWLFTDTLNTLQGLFIFIIFVCKKNVFQLIMAKLCHKTFKKKSFKMEDARPSGASSSSNTNSSQTKVSKLSQPSSP